MLDAAIAVDDVAGIALAGLTAAQKTLPPKLFYDAEGVRLFEAITKLPEYYLTRTERALLADIAPDIVRLAPAGAALVEYGASDEAKALTLLHAPGATYAAYVPIDVAAAALDAMSARLAESDPALHVHPLSADFLQPLLLPPPVRGLPHFGFFPGSTIGNLDPAAARQFLRDARRTLGAGSWLIVGADVRKDPSRLVPAYDDAAGVTAAFNLNILRRLNREAGANFALSQFRHQAVWNDAESRIEMHLVSQVTQTVQLGGSSVSFEAGETIHTENSYKHSIEAMRVLAREAGWVPAQVWTDKAQMFALYALHAV
jgi:dimethylhistidine N-methyltransferase